MSFNLKERNASLSEFPIGKCNSISYSSRNRSFRNIFIAFNGEKKSSSVLTVRPSHFNIKLQGSYGG